jgi:glucose-1-phosphate thymidylyltransferase
LAGGAGTRLRSLTGDGNKHLLPVGDVPMVVHPLRRIAGAGVRQVLVVTGPPHVAPLRGALGTGRDHGCEIAYAVQAEPGGIAQAIGLAEDFAAGEPILVVLADNVFGADLGPFVRAFEERGARGAQVFLTEVPDPERYGVAEVRDGRIVRLVEKPRDPPSRLCVTGIYLYEGRFGDEVRSLRPSGRGEVEVTDLNLRYLQRGALDWALLPGWWTDAGTPESYARACELASLPGPSRSG